MANGESDGLYRRSLKLAHGGLPRRYDPLPLVMAYYEGETLKDLAISDAIRSSEPPALTGTTASARHVVARAMSKDARQRHQSTAEFLDTLRAACLGRTPRAETSSTMTKSVVVLPFVNRSPDPEPRARDQRSPSRKMPTKGWCK